MDELLKKIAILKLRLNHLVEAIGFAAKTAKLARLNVEMSSHGFWSDRVRAERVAQEAKELERAVLFWGTAVSELRDIELLAEEDDRNQSVTLLEELGMALQKLQQSIDEREVETWLNGEHDAAPAIVTIYSGAGGVDAQDWAQMLERMYLRFAERKEWPASILHRMTGGEAGIKNVTMRIAGLHAYGYLKAESGVHRLVRMSPFNADQARHTSFAMVEILPELLEASAITVRPEDVRIDVFRSSGHGGQSVNTTDSAVRITHIKTGMSAVCQNERSQMQNKEQAWRVLLGKLQRYYEAQRDEERQLLRGEFTEAAWGNQIRSYVLHPYKLVKDHRTKYESKNPAAILDGDLMPFIESELRRRAALPR